MAAGYEPSDAQKEYFSFFWLTASKFAQGTQKIKKNSKTMKYSAGYNNGLIGNFLIQRQQWPHKIRIPRDQYKLSTNLFHIIVPLLLNNTSRGNTVMHTVHLL
jgi:hypothetical protein